MIKDNFPIWGLCFANNIDMMGQLDMEIYRKLAADIYHLKIYNKLITMWLLFLICCAVYRLIWIVCQPLTRINSRCEKVQLLGKLSFIKSQNIYCICTKLCQFPSKVNVESSKFLVTPRRYSHCSPVERYTYVNKRYWELILISRPTEFKSRSHSAIPHAI